MKKLPFTLFCLLLPIIIFSQVSTEEVLYEYQIAYCVGSSNSTAWIGQELVIMIEGETPTDRDSTIMSKIIETFENIIDKYEQLTGLTDLPMNSQYDYKPVIEVVIDNCGAGGLAGHGALGMSTGKVFLDEFYNLVEQDEISVPQVFLYELNRNFWLAGMVGFNGKFDWAMDDEPQNYGWWTVGMNNAQAYIIPKTLNIGLHYFGNDINYWETRMVKELEDYMNDEQYDFDYGWRQSLMPWHNTESINDMMSGLIIYSYNNFGGQEWIKGFYEQIQNDEIINRSNVFAYQECRDNIYKIWSFAAKRDLLSFFEEDLRWIISPTAVACVTENLTSTNTSELELFGQVLFPNPVNDFLNIEGIHSKNELIEIYNLQGKNEGQFLSDELPFQIDISGLDKGIYFVKVGHQVHKVIKEQ